MTDEKSKKEPQNLGPSASPKAEEERVFVYDGREFKDPDKKMTNDEVRLYYATFFPELANAEILPAVKRKGEQVIEFKRRTGTKG